MPAGNFLGFVGFNVNNNQSILDAWKTSTLNDEKTREKALEDEAMSRYSKDILGYVDAVSGEIDDDSFRLRIVPIFKNSIQNASNGLAVAKAIRLILNDTDIRLRDFVSTLRRLVEERRKIYVEAEAKAEKQRVETKKAAREAEKESF